MNLAQFGNRYFEEKAPWKSRKEDPEAVRRDAVRVPADDGLPEGADLPLPAPLLGEAARMLGYQDESW